jgi:hypothetical protein
LTKDTRAESEVGASMENEAPGALKLSTRRPFHSDLASLDQATAIAKK